MAIKTLTVMILAAVSAAVACADEEAAPKKAKKTAKAADFPTARQFRTGLLYDAENKATAEFEQPVLELPDWEFKVFQGGTVVDDVISGLDSLDMVMVGSLAADAFTGRGPDYWKPFLERGGTLVITDAGYADKFKWTTDLGEDYDYLSPEGFKGWPPTKIWEGMPEPPIHIFPSKQVYGGILWYHWLQRRHSGRGGKAWQYLTLSRKYHQVVAMMARLGKGFIYITSMRCPYRVFFENMRAASELGLIGLEPVSFSGGEMTNSLGKVEFAVKPLEGTAEPGKYRARLEITSLAQEDAVPYIVDAEGKSGEGGAIAFTIPYENEIRGRARVRLLLAEKGAVESATLIDRPQVFPDFLEIKLPNYRGIVSTARREGTVHLGLKLNPAKEDVRRGEVTVNVVKPSGLKVPVLSKEKMTGLERPIELELPRNAEPGDYRVDVKYKAVLTSKTYTNSASFKMLDVKPEVDQIVVDQDNVLLRDGKPWFPLGLYHVPPASYAKMADMGFDFCQQFGWWFWQMQDLKQYGISCVYEGEPNEQARDKNVVGMWYVADEPQDPYLPRIRKKAEKAHALDIHHPTFYVTLSEASFQYQFEKDVADVIAYDCYPIWVDKETGEPKGDHCAITNHLDQLRAVVKGTKPVLSVLGSWGHESEAQLRVMAYLAITHGANGILWYCWDQQGGGELHLGLCNSEKNQEIMKRLLAEIKPHRPQLTSRFRQPMFLGGGKVSAILCGGDSKDIPRKLICVNPTAEPVEVTEKIEGVKTPFTVEAMGVKVFEIDRKTGKKKSAKKKKVVEQ